VTALNRKLSTTAALLLCVVLFVGITLLSNAILRGWRVDLTATGQYTLASGTRDILKKIDEPITLYLFFSERASENIPALRSYADGVRELLQEMEQRAGGKLRLQVIDPQPFSEEEDQATGFGLQQVPVSQSGDTLIFGLAGTNSTDGQATIPFFDPQKEAFLEYDIAKLVQSLAVPDKPVVGVLSSIALSGGFDPETRQMRDPWVISQQLGELFTMRTLDTTATAIDEDIRTLLLIHPKALSDDTLYAIDQFVLRGGRLLVFVDPSATADNVPEDPNNPMAAMMADRSSNLPKLFEAWGVQYDPAKVVGDRRLGLTLRTSEGSAPQPDVTILGVGVEHMNQADIVSAELEAINLDKTGAFSMKEGSALKLEPLIQSSKEATLFETDRVRFMPNPVELLDGFTPSGEQYIIAGRLTGSFKTAFPDKSGEAHLAEAKEPGTVLLFGDVDLISNRVWVQVQQFMGQQVATPFANNGDLIYNAVENLTGSSSLISIRARQSSQRPFTVVQELERSAQQRYRDTEQRLQQELQQTEQRLTELQQQRQGEQSGVLTLTAEQEAELKRFRDRKIEIRKQLRDVRFNLDREIRDLGTSLKVINIVFMPMLVVIVAILFFLSRSRRRRTAAQAA
jgi:ABC-type uncharacterized transport system involved in gliding motility auxiliary subunit